MIDHAKKLHKWLIIATIIATPLYLVRFDIFSVPTNALELLILLVFVMSACTTDILRTYQCILLQSPSLRRVFFVFALILLGTFLSTWANGNWQTGLGIIKGWFLLPFLFSLSVFVALRKGVISRTHIFRALIVGGTFIALIGIIYAALGMLTYDRRLSAFYLSPNHLAMALAPIVPLSAAGFIIARNHHYSRRTRIFLSFALPLLFLALFLSRSFGGIIAASLGTLFFLISYCRSWRIFFIGTIAAMLGFIIVITILWHTPRIQDFFSIPDRSSIASRVMIWHVAWDIGADNPLLGIGPGNFQNIYLAYQSNYPPYLEWAVPQPHNLYFAFWLQAGIIGFVGFLFLMGMLTKNYWHTLCKKNRTKDDTIALAIFAALFTIFLHGIIDTPYWKNDLALIFWILIILTLVPIKAPFQHKN